jgi:D-arabinose 1-dehydrogenase-like Zn-dependent alcohol dehydrogenase
MKVVQVTKPNGTLELVERPIPEPTRGQVRIKVEACGICHSDVYTVQGLFPGIQYPRVPGHEVVGIIDAVGPDVPNWKKGARVGVGWHGGHCGHCDACRRGDFILCAHHQVPGIAYDGGYAEYMIAPYEALASVPNDLKAVDAAPLLCAGITTFNSLRNSGARAGDTVAILGIGGLGHLGVQFAAKMGFRTVAIARGEDKGPLARKLGAHIYIDSTAKNPAEELTKLGGAKVILATVTDGKTMSSIIPGLSPNGKLVVVGAPDRWAPFDRRMAFGHRERFRRHVALQRAHGRTPDDRNLPARESGGRLCKDAERPCAFPCRAHAMIDQLHVP